jgi:predicted ATPase
LDAGDGDHLFPAAEQVAYWDKTRYSQPYYSSLMTMGQEAGISSPNKGIADYVRQHLNKWRVYHFHDTSSSSPMKKNGELNDNRFLRPDGSNLASFLYYLKEKVPDSYHMIRRAVQRVAPFFEDFELSPLQLNEEYIRLQWRHKNSDAYFDANSFSDGTLRFIALATLFLQPKSRRPSVILVDEPELGLHPYAITMLATLIKQAALETQVILSTQSPLLLDHFAPEDVLVAERMEGGTVLNRLDPDQLSVWLEDYSLGQLWEKNEIGGRPSDE